MIDLNRVSEFVYENFSKVSVSKNGTHWLCRCPLCGDSKKSKSKKRFNLDYNGGNPIFHCWNCGGSGSFLEIYSIIKGISINESIKELFKYNPDSLIQRLSKRKKEKIIKEISYENHNWIMDDCITQLTSVKGILFEKYYNALLNFYKTRKIDWKHTLGIAFKGDYKGRIIIPIYDEHNDIIYFQARRIPGSDLFPKYRNPTLEKGEIIHNKNLFDKNKYIIIVEGLIDAFSIGDQATTCLGSYITDDFIKKLIPLTNKGIIIIFDNDEAGYNSLIRFMEGKRKNPPNKYYKKVKYFLFPKEYNLCDDINSIRVNYNNMDFYNMIAENSHTYYNTYANLKLFRR